jgi:hypothetical protein
MQGVNVVTKLHNRLYDMPYRVWMERDGRTVPLRVVQRRVLAIDILSQYSRFRKQEIT